MVAMAGRTSRRIFFVLTWLAGLAWALWVLRGMPWAQAAQRFQQASWLAWMAWLVWNLGLLLLATLRWWWITRLFVPQISFFRLWIYRQAAFAVNYLTPGPQFGGEPLQVYWLHREGLPWRHALSSLLLEKAFEMGSNLAFLLFVGGGLWWFWGGLPIPAAGLWFSFLLGAVVGMAGYGAVLWMGGRPLTRISHRWPGMLRWTPRVAILEEVLAQALRSSPGSVLAWAGISVLIWVGLVVEYIWIWRLLGADMSGIEALTALVLTRLALLSPFPGGMGILETAQTLVAQWFQVPESIAAGVILVIRVRDVGLALGGWLALLLLRDRRSSVRDDA